MTNQTFEAQWKRIQKVILSDPEIVAALTPTTAWPLPSTFDPGYVERITESDLLLDQFLQNLDTDWEPLPIGRRWDDLLGAFNNLNIEHRESTELPIN